MHVYKSLILREVENTLDILKLAWHQFKVQACETTELKWNLVIYLIKNHIIPRDVILTSPITEVMIAT